MITFNSLDFLRIFFFLFKSLHLAPVASWVPTAQDLVCAKASYALCFFEEISKVITKKRTNNN